MTKIKSSQQVTLHRAEVIKNLANDLQKVQIDKGSDLSTQTSHQSTSVKIKDSRCATKRVSFNSDHPSSLISSNLNSPESSTPTSNFCILQNQLTKVFKSANLSDLTNPLKSHKITTVQRTKMLDWLVEVTFAFKCKERTYFLVAAIFDAYLRSTKGLADKDVHLIGITCLFLGSKYEDLKPLNARVISNKISHQTYDFDEIIESHSKLLVTLEFDLHKTTPYDIVQAVLQVCECTCPNAFDLTLLLVSMQL